MFRFGALFGSALIAATSGPLSAAAIKYPPAPRADQVDDYHGVTVADPYRPLEDLDAAKTRAWVAAEVAVTDRYLNAIPVRTAFKRRLTQLVNYERRGVPVWYGDRYIYSVNTGLQNQPVFYQTPALDQPATVLLDPNKLSSDGTISVGGFTPTRDGKLVAYSLRTSGSDWDEWHVRRTADATDLPDVVKWSKFSGASWARDDSGFYYARFAEPNAQTQFKDQNVSQQVYFHKLGTPQSADVLIYERPDDPYVFFGPYATLDGRYLVITESKGGPKNGVVYRDLRDPAGKFVRLFEPDAAWNYVYNAGTRFFFQTDKGAARGQVIAFDLQDPARSATVVPEAADALQNVDVLDGKLVTEYSHDVHTVLKLWDLDGGFLQDVPLPGLGAAAISGWPDRVESFITYTDYTTPSSIYRFDLRTGRRTVYFSPHLQFDPAAYVSEQVFVTSKDGTRVPMFLVHKRGLARNGTAPTILTGYGGFDIPVTPSFSSFNIPWLELGGVIAVVNLRGGSEYGEAWHQAGMLERKQNVFNDFFAAAQWLIDRKVTSPAKLAARGGSNGGLLVGAAITQRPELFGAAIPQVGVLDMLRFHKWTIGSAWIPEYGSADDPAQFKTLYAYSPLQNLKKGKAYPATLIMTADHDDRVFPAHSFKFAAAMQADQGGAAPVLIRIETKAGHGGGTPIAKSIEEYADMYAFLWKNLGVTATPP